MQDTPWGAEELVLTSDIEVGGEFDTIALRRIAVEHDEMTSYHVHREQNELLFVQNGLVEIREEDDYAEVEEGEAFFIAAGEPHQIQNIDDEVVELVQLYLPFDPDDITRIEDPYEHLR